MVSHAYINPAILGKILQDLSSVVECRYHQQKAVN